ncbi:ubiquitin-related domain-containing protein [Geopyxis carbonaria]|nr:ubiquitin-related domain-containing protein [Geopyxis carbonaria]
MVQSDYDLLVEMGFDAQRAKLAADRTNGLQDAIDWLDKNQERSLQEIESEGGLDKPLTEKGQDEDGDKVEEAGTAASLKCTDCGKLFSSPERAQFHAARSEHTNFEESTEIIQPLTEEQKKAKLIELREKLAEKKAAQAILDREEQKRNEAIRRKKAQNSEDIKEQLRKQQQLKEVAKRKQEKVDDLKAKERVRQQIKETQEARRRQQESEKASREGKVVVDSQEIAKPVTSKPTVSHSETRLQLRLPTGQPPLVKVFSADTTLFEVASTVESENGFCPTSFTMTFPRKTFQKGIDFGLTLKEAGMVPSCALIVG